MIRVFCDFDGTITTRDGTDFVLERLALPEWHEIEEQWEKGLLGSAECMRRQIALIRATRQELDRTLDELEIDCGFPAFAAFCRQSKIPVTIISDGVDYFIRHVLKRHGLDEFPVIANRLTITPENRYQLASPYCAASCISGAGVCKCKVVSTELAIRLYVGDGRSDFCVSSKPEFVFAKGKLAAYCKQNDMSFLPYQDFHDVIKGIQRLIPGTRQTELEEVA